MEAAKGITLGSLSNIQIYPWKEKAPVPAAEATNVNLEQHPPDACHAEDQDPLSIVEEE